MWKVTYRELALIESEDGFVEAVAEHMGFWLTQRHVVMAAILKKATDQTNPKMMDDAKAYLAMTQPRKNIDYPARKRTMADEDEPGDDAEVDLART